MSNADPRAAADQSEGAHPREAADAAGELARLRAHIATRLACTELERTPFPHLIVEEFFPADVYAGILRFNPFREHAGSEWLSPRESDNVSAGTPYFARKQLDFAAGVPFAAPPAAAAFWARIRACFLADDWFERAIAGTYPEYFSLRFGDIARDPDFFTLLRKQLFLQRHEPGFHIGPHTDLPVRIFTCIFSFADRDGFEEYGTQLLAHKDRLVRCWGTDHHAPDDFEVRKLAPYRPNTMLLFFKTRHTFHAVPVIDERVPNQRYGMQFQLREPPEGLFRDLSAPELMHFKRRTPSA